MIGLQIDKSIELLMGEVSRKIDNTILKTVCNIRQSEKACRYIMLGSQGFVCMKHTKIRQAIDSLCDKDQMTAKGDNCHGLGETLNAYSEEPGKTPQGEEIKKKTKNTLFKSE